VPPVRIGVSAAAFQAADTNMGVFDEVLYSALGRRAKREP